jgi:hypothetical protein
VMDQDLSTSISTSYAISDSHSILLTENVFVYEFSLQESFLHSPIYHSCVSSKCHSIIASTY